MKTRPYSFLTLILAALALLFSGLAMAEDIDATLPDSDNTSSFQVKNSESSDNVLMKIQSGGNVGIGTTSPGAKLEVKNDTSSSNDLIRLREKFADSEGSLRNIAWWDELNQRVAAIGSVYDGTSNNILFHSQWYGTEKSETDVTMAVMGTGKVGIGTTSPDEKLDVNGNVQISGTNGKVVFPASHYDEKIELYKGGDEKIGTADNQLKLIAGSGTTDNIAFFGDSAEVMRVKTGSSGNVGIGTTDPKEKFQIGDRFTFNGQVDGTDSWRVISDNAYYDGTDGHDKRIVTDFAAAMAFTDDGDILFRTAPSGSGNGILDNGDYSTWDTGTAPLFVQNDGKIGIGTDSPNSTLHVSGSLSVKRTPVASDYPPSGETWGTTIIGVTSVPTAGLTVTLPNAVEGRIIYIKDESGQAGLTTGQDITINTTDSQTQTIDGEVSYTISDSYGSLKVYSNGINWFIIGAFGGGGG